MEESFEERTKRISRLEEEKEYSARRLEQAKEDFKKEMSRIKWMEVVYKLLFGISIISFILLILSVFNNDIQDGSYFDKKEIQQSLNKIINNGGSIDEVKQVYNNRNLEERRIVFKSSDYVKSHYISDTPLSSILSDLLVEYYKQDSIIPDSVYVMNLRDMITSYEMIHPFDGLEENQRYYLENIRLKLDSNYYYIQDDLVKLGDELDRKNLLVTKYLNKSETSFWISIIAIAITILLSGWQIYQSYISKKQLDRFFSEHSNNERQKD